MHHHHHHHGCSHGHGGNPQDKHRNHTHHHVPENFNSRFAWGAGINMLFVVAELGFGIISNSLGLIADAAHNFSDVIGLLLAWGGAWLSRLNPTAQRTYGYSGASILAALANASLLFIAIGGIFVQAVNRFMNPQPVESMTIIWVAMIGIVINGATAMIFHKGQEHDLNIRGAYLHMVADTAISLGVVIAGVIIMYTNWLWVDPVVSVAIAVIIAIGTWNLATEALHLSLAGVPKHVNRDEVHKFLFSLPGVTEVHDLHIWGMSTTQTALTAHLLRPNHGIDDEFLHHISDELLKRFNIQHPTIQLESGKDSQPCRLAPENVL